LEAGVGFDETEEVTGAGCGAAEDGDAAFSGAEGV
jgi:hypothetical protein